MAASGLYHYLSKLLLRGPFSYFLYFNLSYQATEKQPLTDVFQKGVLENVQLVNIAAGQKAYFTKKRPQHR